MTTPEENEQIARKFPEEVISEKNIDLIDEIFTEDVIDHHSTFGKTRGREALKQTTEYFHSAFEGSSAKVEDILADENRVAIRWSGRGFHEGEFMGIEPTGKTYVIEVTMFARMQDGKIAERWLLEDTVDLLRQLGVNKLPQE